jgi:hypothetical protein
MKARALVRELIPEATEELDPSGKLIAFTFIPGTYKGLFTAVAPHGSYVNLMFSKGVELSEVDTTGLLEGTGKHARHVKVRTADVLADPQLRTLIEAAAAKTPRSQ